MNLELRAAPTNATAAPPRTTLLFVVRDHVPGHGGTPLDVLESQLKAQLDEVWAAVSKPPDCELALGDLFEVQVVALPHLRLQKDLWHAAADCQTPMRAAELVQTAARRWH